jgi:hypothetical protein
MDLDALRAIDTTPCLQTVGKNLFFKKTLRNTKYNGTLLAFYQGTFSGVS